MKRLCLAFFCGVVLFVFAIRPAMAVRVFGTEFKAKYVKEDPQTDAEKAFAEGYKKAKCYLCHVKGKDKEYCNTYGDALAKFLHKDDFEKDRVEDEPDAVRAEILQALEKVESMQDVCGDSFGQIFKAGKTPNAELGPESAKKEEEDEDEEDDEDEE